MVGDLGFVENEAESGGFSQAGEETVFECGVVDFLFRGSYAVLFHFEQRESDRVEARHDQGKDLVFFLFFFVFFLGLPLHFSAGKFW